MRIFSSNVYRGGIAAFNPARQDGGASFDAFNIAALITVSTWATVGPIGSGADIETDVWCSHRIPQEGIVGIKGYLLTSNRWSSSGTASITVYANSPDVETAIVSNGSRLYSHTEYPGGVEAVSEGSQRDTEVIIPVDKNRITRLRWTSSGTGVFTAQFTPTQPVF